MSCAILKSSYHHCAPTQQAVLPACLQTHKQHNRFKDVDDKQKNTTTQFCPCVQFALLHDNVLQTSTAAPCGCQKKRRGWEEYRCADVHSFHLLWAETSQMKRPAGQTGGAASVTHPSATFPFWIGLKLPLQSDALKTMNCFSAMQNKKWGIRLAGQTLIIWCPKKSNWAMKLDVIGSYGSACFYLFWCCPEGLAEIWLGLNLDSVWVSSWILKSSKNIIKEK